MPDPLTPDEIAAIAAFPPERVQKIPRGFMTNPSPKRHLSGSIRRLIALRNINKPQARALWTAGLGLPEISARLKITHNQAREYTMDLREAANRYWK